MNKLYIFCGLPFSGKTTISKEIAKRPDYLRIDLDEVKDDLLGEGVKDEEVSQENWDKVYQEMYKRVETGLKQGKNVLQDAGNFTQYERGLVREIANRLGIESVVVYINAPKEEARKRLLQNKQTHKRFDVSEEFIDGGIKEMEPPKGDEVFITYILGEPLANWIKKNFPETNQVPT